MYLRFFNCQILGFVVIIKVNCKKFAPPHAIAANEGIVDCVDDDDDDDRAPPRGLNGIVVAAGIDWLLNIGAKNESW